MGLAKMPNFRGKAAALHPTFTIAWPESHPHFIPTLNPRATLMSLSLPDGPSNVVDQAGGMPFGICRNVRQSSSGGGCHRGSAGSRFIHEPAKPATGPASHS